MKISDKDNEYLRRMQIIFRS